VFLALPVSASDVATVRGQLHFQSRQSTQGLYAGLEDIVSHAQFHRVDIRLDGTFEFRGVPTGEYLLKITNLEGETVFQQFATVHEHIDEISVSMPDSGSTKSLRGKVSVTQLLHPPERKAVNAFHTALRLSESGKYDQAVAELEKALRISPEFGQAYTNLAVQHIRLQQYDLAIGESKRAMEIGGEDPINLCNIAFAQFQLRLFEDSELSSRAALRLDSGYLQAHLVLGTLLARNRATREEAIRHLKLAATQFASAQKTLDSVRAAQ
jgi:tetratricopeptide (TPR) repeat protein